MKFWKPTLVTSLIFFAVVTAITYVACERNPCDNVTCFNGGSCNSGTCRCPTGYEDPQCQTLSTARYVGTYVGSTTCNSLSSTIDTAIITTDAAGILNVDVSLKSLKPKVIKGKVNNNVSTYSIIVSNNDTTVVPHVSFDYETYTVTLQSDKLLTINIYHQLQNPIDTLNSSCIFTGTKIN